MPTATLFGSRLSPFVEKVVRALALKRVPFRLVPPRTPLDLRRSNPQTGKMPVLEIDGERLFDSTLILRRLDALVPEPPLHDPDARVAARQRLLEDWSDESLYWYGMALRWSAEHAPASAAQVVGSMAVPAVLRPVAAVLATWQIGGQARAQGLARLPLALVVAELGRRLDELVVLLGDRPFFFADRPSVADLALFGQAAMLTSGPTPEGEALLRERPALVAWRARVAAATAA
jgi:glutathione S-transferase